MQGRGARKYKVREFHRLNESCLQTMFFWMYELKFTKTVMIMVIQETLFDRFISETIPKYFKLSLVGGVTCAQ